MTEIYARLVDHTITNTTEVNDFSVGSAMRSIFEAIAIEMEQFYILTRENIKEAIEAGVYSSFGFTRKGAQKAYGVVQIEFHNTTQQPLVISRGTRFSSSYAEYNQVFETLEEYYIPKGSLLAEVEVYCITPGEYGNVPVNVINIMNTPIVNLKEVHNPQAFQTGQNEEPIEELRSRFRSFIKSLSKATIPAVEYGVRTIPEVSGVWIAERTGLITVYAHDRNGNLPDSVKKKIEGQMINYRPGGIPVVIKAVKRREVDVTVTVTLTNQAAVTNTFKDKITREVERYLNNMQTSQNLVLSDLSSVIKYIDRQLIYDVKFTTPIDNINVEGSEIIRAGNIVVNLK